MLEPEPTPPVFPEFPVNELDTVPPWVADVFICVPVNEPVGVVEVVFPLLPSVVPDIEMEVDDVAILFEP